LLTGAVAGKGVFYYVTIASILAVLALSANTSFAGFPRVCHAMAQNRYLPYGFTVRGRRLVYSQGVFVLAILSAILLIVFGGVTDHLIPLFAIGAFLSFTLSQAGMVAHWRSQHESRSHGKMLLNAFGAAATGLTVLIVAVAKFAEGAWITLAIIPMLLLLMTGIRRHYHRVATEIGSASPLVVANLAPPLVVVPIDDWNRVAKKALRFAITISDRVQALHIDSGERPTRSPHNGANGRKGLRCRPAAPCPNWSWSNRPYRMVAGPILTYLRELARKHPDRGIAIVLSELVERRWYQYFLHNQRADVLTALLTLDGDERISVINVPWHMKA
jgi:hypothetical protein